MSAVADLQRAGAVVLCRERTYRRTARGDVARHCVGGEDVDASAATDRLLVHWPRPDGLPSMSVQCADCGGPVVYAEAGGVPGSRRCEDCGSAWTDLAYGAPPEWLAELTVEAVTEAARPLGLGFEA